MHVFHRFVLLPLGVILLTASVAFGQGDWTGSLIFDPYPSPYLSDWDIGPNIGQADLFNNTSDTVRARAMLTIARRGQGQIASAESRIFEFPPGSSTNINTRDLIDENSIEYDRDIEEIAVRTGRLPEGEYDVCLRLEHESGAVLLDALCAQFTIVYPDPPYLVYPPDEQSIADLLPIFQWTPVQVPVNYRVRYSIRLTEILSGQMPAQALAANYPHLSASDLSATSFQYPISALSLKKGARYAWQVQVLDDKGYPPSTNSGYSEIWSFLYDADTTTPIVYRRLEGRAVDGETGQSLAGATVVYRPIRRAITDGDTTWAPVKDSLVVVTDASGLFRFDSANDQSYFSVSASAKDYVPQTLTGQTNYQNGDIRNYVVRLAFAPPGDKRLAGVLKDFFSDQPVPDAEIVYHVVEPSGSRDSSGATQFNYQEHPRKVLRTTTDPNGRFEFTQAADSSHFSLRATQAPSYLNAVEIGPNQRQEGDIDDYILLIKPNASAITGTLKTLIGGKDKPVTRAIVQLERSAVVEVATRTFGLFATTRQVVETTTVNATAYSDAGGGFRFSRVSQEKPVTVEKRTIGGYLRIPIVTTTTYLSYSYRVKVRDDRFRPYVSPDSIITTPGETSESGEHYLTPKSGSIAGHVRCDTFPVEGATVYLFPPVRQSRGDGAAGEAGRLKGLEAGSSRSGSRAGDQFKSGGWGESGSQRPRGEALDLVQTDQSGAYAFAAVPINDPVQSTERYIIWVEATGYSPATRGDRLDKENEVDTVDFKITRERGVLHGLITDNGNEPIGGVRVELQPVPAPGSDSISPVMPAVWVESGGDGAYTIGNIEPGVYRVTYTKSGFTPLVTDTFRVTYGDRFQRDIQLDKTRRTVAVTIVDKDAKGLTDVCVKSPQLPSLIGFTDAEGKLLVSHSQVDSLTLHFRKIGFADLDTTVPISADTTMEFKTTMVKSVGQILVRVVEKGSTPQKRLQNMSARLGSAKGNDTSNVIEMTTDANGEAWFTEAPVGQQDLRVAPPESETYAQDWVVVETRVTVRAGMNVEPIVIELTPGARIDGVVKSKEDGSLLENVTVSAAGNDKIRAQTDKDGVFKLRNVPTGESITLLARRAGYKSTRFLHDKKISAGDKITGIVIELEKSPMDSLFGFPIALDSIKSGTGGRQRAWGEIINIPPTFGLKLRNESSTLRFADVEVDSTYKPTSDTIALSPTEIEVNMFGFDGRMQYSGGLLLEWIDSVKAGRITGDVKLDDPLSKIFPETKFIEPVIPKAYAPSFWAGGVNRGLNRFGITATDKEVQIKIKQVKLGLDYTKTHVDTAGLHLFGTIYFGEKFEAGFDELIIGRNSSGEISIKAITIKTKPAIEIPFYAFTVVDSAMSWEATGFRASGAIRLDKLKQPKEFGFKDLRISPEGEFLSLTLTADKENGTIDVHGQKFQIESLEFGTENFADETKEHVKYFAFSGKLTLTSLDKPVGLKLKYTEKNEFTGKLEFNQSKTFAGVVTVTLESIEIGKDTTRGQFVGISGGIKFGAVKGLNVQASNLRFWYDGGVSVDEIGLAFVAGPAEVKIRVKYADGVFEGQGLLDVKPIFNAGAEFRYAGTSDWWVRIIVGTRIPIGAVEIVQVSGGVGLKDNVWKFSLGGVVAPAKADKGIRLDMLVEVLKTPRGVIVLGNANVEVGSGSQIGRATIEINLPEKRVNGSIVCAMDFKALKANAQLDLGVQFGEYWYVYGRANVDLLNFFKNDGVIVIANNWQWQRNGASRLMSGIYVELNSALKVDANWYIIKWGFNFDRHGTLYIGWNGDFSGSIDMAGGAYAWIGFGSFDLIEARGAFALGAHLSYVADEWRAGARGRFSLEGKIGYCHNASCWSICWTCCIRVFGHCIFAVPTGAKACIGMNAFIDYSTSRGTTWDISF